jgi:alanine racemase
MMRPVQALIDLDALTYNLRKVKMAAPRAQIMAIIKANGYGHGSVRVAKALAEADAFGVASLEEAMTLRESGITQSLVLLAGFFSPDELELLARQRIEPVIHHVSQIDILERTPLSRPLSLWVKFDTGMHRLGFPAETVRVVWERLSAWGTKVHRLRLLTHLANADRRKDPLTLKQLELFERTLHGITGERSVANSAGILSWPETITDWVRPGIMLYGISPFVDETGPELGLRPVMTLQSRLIAINRFKRGESIGYGGTWVCPEDMPVGVVAIGYGDGYPRHVPSGTPVLVNGKPLPLVGRVSMDLVSLDLRTQPDVKIGDPVVLWGHGLPVEVMARMADTIPYELICGITPRVRRVEKTAISDRTPDSNRLSPPSS